MSPATGQTAIREFQTGDETAFRRLNEEWITRYFRMEAKDSEALNHPHTSILAPGGRIVLSGILAAQANAALPAYRGLALEIGRASCRERVLCVV